VGVDASIPVDAAAPHDAAKHHDAGAPHPRHDAGVNDARADAFDARKDVFEYPDGQCAPSECDVIEPSFAIDAGSTWSALYRDYFGSSGVASCAGSTGNCHGQPDAAGVAMSQYLCPPHDAAACYAGFTLQGSSGPSLIDGDAGFDAGPLPDLLCTCGGIGNQPLGCCYVFQPVDMDRIANWVNAGAKGD
jgi:hypothetical protein